MKQLPTLLLIALCAWLGIACESSNESFEGKEAFVQDFENRQHFFEGTDFLSVFDRDLSNTQREALQFLYAYMPLPDITDYSGDFHLNNVNYSLKARTEMPWGKTIPDREFLHFVLPSRVNNENLDECRGIFYDELKERVRNLSMYDAVLEVNHWCHEKVTYKPSDARTSSPLATVRTAHGRCGEESTFTVSALRAVGIPARQVYTPRWAHTDDNHAWVEAWVDGKWYFLGACEPEPVLNLGWFNAPASRAMLMHTNVFGNYNGPEEVLARNNCFTEINVTSNYAPVATTTVQVTDSEGNVVKALVEFKIYNYAEFYSAAKKECDENGCTSLTTGCGDVLVWASHNGAFGFAKYTAGKDSVVKVVLDKSAGYEAQLTLDVIPPVERNNTPQLTEQQINENKCRFIQEDSIRNAYVATFPTKEDAIALAHELHLNEEYVVALISQSRGNYENIITYLRGIPELKRNRALRVLFEMAEKDLRDVSLEVLKDHYPMIANTHNESDVFYQYLLNPRVSNEKLTPYRSFFNEVITTEEMSAYKENPELWVAWCRDNIKVESLWNPRHYCMSPMGVWKMRIADSHSRDIFFVSAARSMGIVSRIDEVTGKTQYWKDNVWYDVNFESKTEAQTSSTGVLRATYTPTPFLDNPRYYSHFSISKVVDGRLQLLNYPEDATWQSLLRNGESLDAGNYLITTGTRMANGGVLAHLHFVNVTEDEKTQIELVQRESNDKLQVIGNFNSENIFYDANTQQLRSLLSATGRGYYIIALVAPNNEPTNHFLNDLKPYKEVFEQWGQKIVLVFNDPESLSRFKVDEFPSLPSTVVLGADNNRVIYNEIVNNMKLQSPQHPIILVADTFNRIVFISQGYSIGLGEQLVKVINQLSE